MNDSLRYAADGYELAQEMPDDVRSSRRQYARVHIDGTVISVTNTEHSNGPDGVWRWSIRTPKWCETGENLFTSTGPAATLRRLCFFLAHDADNNFEVMFNDRTRDWAKHHIDRLLFLSDTPAQRRIDAANKARLEGGSQ